MVKGIYRIYYNKLNDVDEIEYYENGNVWYFEYCYTDIIRKYIVFIPYETCNYFKRVCCWEGCGRNPLSKGKPHLIDYYENGSISLELYCVDNKKHRSDGPAYVSYNENGEIVLERFFLNDIEYTKDEFLEKRIH